MKNLKKLKYGICEITIDYCSIAGNRRSRDRVFSVELKGNRSTHTISKVPGVNFKEAKGRGGTIRRE